MKVSLDISALDPDFKEHAQRGIGRYVRELKNYFDSLNEKKSATVDYFSHSDVGGKVGRFFAAASDFLPAGRTTVKQQFILPFLYRGYAGSRLLHFPAHMDAPSRGMPPYVLTVLDLIPQVLSDLYKANKPDWRFRLARHLENESIRNAKLLLCISECTARDVNRILGVPWERLRVTPLGIDQKFFKASPPQDRQQFLSKWNLPPDRPLILYVGGIDPRKNIGFAVEVINELGRRAKNSAGPQPVLVIAGQIEKDREYQRLLSHIEETGMQSSVRLLGFVPDEDLLSLYHVCAAFFFPSLYEGFGLPPLEAMAAGLPVVSSGTSCMPEILGEAATYINPAEVSEAANALQAVISGEADRDRMIEQGKKQAEKFSWQITGDKTVECYNEALAL